MKKRSPTSRLLALLLSLSLTFTLLPLSALAVEPPTVEPPAATAPRAEPPATTPPRAEPPATTPPPAEPPAITPPTTAPVAPPVVTASAAIVMDADTGAVYYEKNADVPRPSASMSKIMSLYLVFEEIEAGRLALDTPIPISARAAEMSRNRAYSGLETFPIGGTCPVNTLLQLIMTQSGCASVLALAEHVAGSEKAFVARMNAKAAEWGIAARYADCTGYIDEGNAVSPRAMAELTRRILSDYPSILDYSSLPSITYQDKVFSNNNRLLVDGSYPGIDGLKSGATNSAGYCFAGTAIRDGRRIITVVMQSSSGTARLSDTKTLLDYGFFSLRDLSISGLLGFDHVSMRPGNTITVPIKLYCEQNTNAIVSSGWYLNGEPIQGYANANFALTPTGSSAYTFLAAEGMKPGEYVLSFRCNTNNTSGIAPAEFSMVLEILP